MHQKLNQVLLIIYCITLFWEELRPFQSILLFFILLNYIKKDATNVNTKYNEALGLNSLSAKVYNYTVKVLIGIGFFGTLIQIVLFFVK